MNKAFSNAFFSDKPFGDDVFKGIYGIEDIGLCKFVFFSFAGDLVVFFEPV